MLLLQPHKDIDLSNIGATILIIIGIVSGIVFGLLSPSIGKSAGNIIDYVVFLLVLLLFFDLKFDLSSKISSHLRFLSVVWLCNFVIIPTIGFLIARLFFAGKPQFFIGLLIYFIAPCTDWFLGFTKMAKGNVSLGALLIPINMVSQLLLYPVFLWIFGRQDIVTGISWIDPIAHWFIMPFAIAFILRFLLNFILQPPMVESIRKVVGLSIPYIISLLVLLIFASNVGVIIANIDTLSIILIAVFLFFVITFFMGEGLARLFKFQTPDYILLSMTTAARNAPLMLSVTMLVFPNQPLLYAAIIMGMLVEFPHLTLLTFLLRRKTFEREI